MRKEYPIRVSPDTKNRVATRYASVPPLLLALYVFTLLCLVSASQVTSLLQKHTLR